MLYEPKYKNRKALIIGINKYKNVSPLVYACDDAEEVAKILKDKFNFAKEDIILLKDDKATKDRIMKSFHGFTQNNTNPDDKLLVFFADKNGDSHLFMSKLLETRDNHLSKIRCS